MALNKGWGQVRPGRLRRRQLELVGRRRRVRRRRRTRGHWRWRRRWRRGVLRGPGDREFRCAAHPLHDRSRFRRCRRLRRRRWPGRLRWGRWHRWRGAIPHPRRDRGGGWSWQGRRRRRRRRRRLVRRAVPPLRLNVRLLDLHLRERGLRIGRPRWTPWRHHVPGAGRTGWTGPRRVRGILMRLPRYEGSGVKGTRIRPGCLVVSAVSRPVGPSCPGIAGRSAVGEDYGGALTTRRSLTRARTCGIPPCVPAGLPAPRTRIPLHGQFRRAGR